MKTKILGNEVKASCILTVLLFLLMLPIGLYAQETCPYFPSSYYYTGYINPDELAPDYRWEVDQNGEAYWDATGGNFFLYTLDHDAEVTFYRVDESLATATRAEISASLKIIDYNPGGSPDTFIGLGMIEDSDKKFVAMVTGPEPDVNQIVVLGSDGNYYTAEGANWFVATTYTLVLDKTSSDPALHVAEVYVEGDLKIRVPYGDLANSEPNAVPSVMFGGSSSVSEWFFVGYEICSPAIVDDIRCDHTFHAVNYDGRNLPEDDPSYPWNRNQIGDADPLIEGNALVIKSHTGSIIAYNREEPEIVDSLAYSIEAGVEITNLQPSLIQTIAGIGVDDGEKSVALWFDNGVSKRVIVGLKNQQYLEFNVDWEYQHVYRVEVVKHHSMQVFVDGQSISGPIPYDDLPDTQNGTTGLFIAGFHASESLSYWDYVRYSICAPEEAFNVVPPESPKADYIPSDQQYTAFNEFNEKYDNQYEMTFPVYQHDVFRLLSKTELEYHGRYNKKYVEEFISDFSGVMDIDLSSIELLSVNRVDSFYKSLLSNKDYCERLISEGRLNLYSEDFCENPSKAIAETIAAENDISVGQAVSLLQEDDVVYNYMQYYDGVPLFSSYVAVHLSKNSEITSVEGRYFDEIEVSNQILIGIDDVESINIPRGNGKNGIQLVLLPYGDSFRYAYLFNELVDGINTLFGIDAESGNTILKVREVYTACDFDGFGYAYYENPDESVPEIVSFETCPPYEYEICYIYNGHFWCRSYTLIDLLNDLAIPYNNTEYDMTILHYPEFSFTVGDLDDPSKHYLAEINAFWHFNEWNDFFTFHTFAAVTEQIQIVTHRPNAAGSAAHLHIILGGGTIDTPNSSGYYDAALDADVVHHESSHLFTAWKNFWHRYPGSTQWPDPAHFFSHHFLYFNGAVNEGIADFLTCSYYNDPLFAEFFGRDKTVTQYGDKLPRAIDADDIFPDHRHIGGTNMNRNEHSEGQVVAHAFWKIKEELVDSVGGGVPGGSATYLAHAIVLEAIPYIDFDATRNCKLGPCPVDREMFVVFQDLHSAVMQAARDKAHLRYRLNQISASFARVGIFPGKKTAIIDAERDYVLIDEEPPYFEIWTGTPYDFDDDGNSYYITVPTIDQYNTSSLFEVADNPDFTNSYQYEFSNPWNHFNVSLPASEFAKFYPGEHIYYRVRTYTRDPNTSEIIPGTSRTSNVDRIYIKYD